MNDVLKLPLDMSCLSESSVDHLAAKFAPEDLEKIRDKKDKIISRLYQKKAMRCHRPR